MTEHRLMADSASSGAGLLPVQAAGFCVRLLTSADTASMLAFELKNKDFFSALIAPRPDDVFSEAGMSEYVRELLFEHQLGKAHPCVIMDASGMIGRANLWQIDRQSCSAYVGYRVAEHRQGEGIATQALRHLIQCADHQLGLNTLKANVLDNNPASARVLEKQGFTVSGRTEQFLELNGQSLGCQHFQRCL